MRARRPWLWALGLVLLLPVLATCWLLGTESGLRFALSRAAAAMPELQLRVGSVTGRAGALRIDALSLRLAGRELRAADIHLAWRPLALLSEHVVIDRLQVGSLEIGPAIEPVDPDAQVPFDLDQWQWSYPIPALPVSVELRDVALGSASLEDGALWQRVDLAGALDPEGRLRVDRLEIARAGDALSLRGRWPVDTSGEGLQGQWRWAGTGGVLAVGATEQGAWLRLTADEGRVELAADLKAPHRWSIDLAARDAHLGTWVPGIPEPLSAELGLRGEGSRAQLQGRIDTPSIPVQALQGAVRWHADSQRLQIESLQLQHPHQGTVTTTGAVRWGETPQLSLHVDLDHWALLEHAGGVDQGPALTGQLMAEGWAEALRVDLTGELSRASQRLPLKLGAQWDGRVLEVEQLTLDGEAGTLNGRGRVWFEPEIGADLALEAEGLDPAWVDPRLSGRLSLDGVLRAQQAGEQWTARLELPRLEGELQGAPVAGQGALEWRGDALGGDLAVRLGDGRVTLSGGGDQARVDIEALQLALIEPASRGEASGTLTLSGLPEQVNWRADLRVEGLRRGDLHVDRLAVEGGLGAADPDTLRVAWSGAGFATEILGQSGALALEGRLDRYRATLESRGEGLALSGAWQGGVGDVTGADIEALELDSPRFGRWALEAPGSVQITPDLRVTPLCLRSDESRLCLAPEDAPAAAAPRWVIELTGLPLARLMAGAGQAEHLAVDGALSARVTFRVAPEVELLEVSGSLLQGRVVDRSLEQPLTLLEWASADGSLTATDERWAGRVDARLLPAGEVVWEGDVAAEAPFDSSRWSSQLKIDIDRLQALALLAPDVTAAQGALRGTLRWTPGQPTQGEIVLSDFSARVPALGIALRESSIGLRQGETGLLVDGLLDTGEGPLRLEGEVQTGADLRARVRVAGEGVLLADTRRLSLRVSPELQVGWRDGALRLRGEVAIPRALIDLERLEAGVQPSSDVAVLDPRESQQGAAALPLDVDLKVRLGDEVRLSGFGFDGRIEGQLTLRETPGRAMQGRGTLNLGGQYRAYGQELEIERGRLLYAASALDNPGIDLRARRPLREVEVGVEVRGPARRPRLSLWSKPAMDQAEALSWLILGQPLASATEADGAQLGQAAAAVGGNLLAAQVGGRLGFDTFGVSDSQALGGAAFTVGKYLSPRLYLGYGVGLFEPGRVVTLRYLIGHGFDVEVESARESRAGVNYRLETD